MSAKSLHRSDLRHRVTVRRSTETSTGTGGFVSSWADVFSCFAEVTGLDGRESVMDQVLQGVSVFRLRVRWTDNIKPADQVRAIGAVFGGRDLNIRSAVDPDGRRQQLVIIADTAATRSS